MTEFDLAEALGRHGLRQRGAFAVDPAQDGDLLRHAPGTRSVLMVGNVGAELWERSAAAIAAIEGLHPLDDWTKATIDPIAEAMGGVALYPSAGPPYWPFQRWAQRAEGVRPSPLGIFIHPTYGLWHAYRAAILVPVEISVTPASREHPCDTCTDRPCLSRCPVGAFSGASYDVESCVRHVVATKAQPGACWDKGCLARLACPIGVEWQYGDEQMQFHTNAFIRARLAARSGVKS